MPKCAMWYAPTCQSVREDQKPLFSWQRFLLSVLSLGSTQLSAYKSAACEFNMKNLEIHREVEKFINLPKLSDL